MSNEEGWPAMFRIRRRKDGRWVILRRVYDYNGWFYIVWEYTVKGAATPFFDSWVEAADELCARTGRKRSPV